MRPLLLILLALPLQLLAYVHFFGGDLHSLTFSDEKQYYLTGAKLYLEQGMDFFKTPRSLWNGPVNIFWIALWKCNIPLIKLINLLLLNLAALLSSDIARKLFGPKAAYLVLGAIIFYPGLAEFGPTLLSEPLFIFLFMFSLWGYIHVKSSQLFAIIAGVIFGLAALTRPTIQYFPLFLLIPLFLTRRSYKKEFSFALGALLLILPWSAKNSKYFGEYTIATGSGAVLYLGNDLKKDGDEPIYSEMDFDTWELTKPHTHLDIEGDKRLREQALNSIIEYPLDTALLSLRKTFRYLFGTHNTYFFPSLNLKQYSASHKWWEICLTLLHLLLTVIVSGTGLVAILISLRGAKIAFLYAALIVYFIALHSVTFPIPRLALPIYPLLTIYGGGFLMNTHLRLKAMILIFLTGIAIVISSGFFITSRQIVSERYLNYFKAIKKLTLSDAVVSDLERQDDGSYMSVGPRPEVKYTLSSFDAKKNQVLFLPLTINVEEPSSDNPKFLRLKWSTGRKRIPVHHNSGRHIYRISPSLLESWNGSIRELKIILPIYKRDARYRIGTLVLAE